MAKLVENKNSTVNLITSSTQLTGNINTETDIRIDGELIGNLMTAGRLIIGQTGRIKGDIKCKLAEIEGVIEGKIEVKELLSLKSTSNLTGEVTTTRLMIEPGALFSGNCKMNNPSEKNKK